MCLMGKLTMSIAMFNSFLYVYQAGYITLGPPLQIARRPFR
jgi:hypothetical protein